MTPTFSPTTELSLREILEHWVGTDHTLRAALNAHSSLSTRQAEEERTRQEYYRLETRRVEYELLREALRGGVHPSLIPQLFNHERDGTQNLSPMSPIQRPEERTVSAAAAYPTSSLPSYNRPSLPKIETSNLPPPQSNRIVHLIPPREKYAGPISAPPASMATTSPPPSIFFRHWAPPRSVDDQQLPRLSTSREEPESRYHDVLAPSSNRKSPQLYDGKRASSLVHGRQRSEAMGSGRESRHHPYSSRDARVYPSYKRNEGEEGLGAAAKSPLDRETVMRALREKVAPRREDEVRKREDESKKREDMPSSKIEVEKVEKKDSGERRKPEQGRDVMALEQLVEKEGKE
jgi:hypothetical protein